MGRRSGFTLIEILVALTIVCILAGIVLPALHTSRLRAKRPVCLSNMRQIGVALEAYAHDWDGYIPPYTTARKGYLATRETDPPTVIDYRPFNDTAALKRCLEPYGLNERLWWCPADPDPGEADAQSEYMMDHARTSYYVDFRVAIWRPVSLDVPPTLSLKQWQEYRPRPCLLWTADNPKCPGVNYLGCPFHHRDGGKDPVLLFDGSIVYSDSTIEGP